MLNTCPPKQPNFGCKFRISRQEIRISFLQIRNFRTKFGCFAWTLDIEQVLNGQASFPSFNVSKYLADKGESYPGWSSSYSFPMFLVVKNTSSIRSFSGDFTDPVNLESDQNGYDSTLADPNKDTFPTEGLGPTIDFLGTEWSARQADEPIVTPIVSNLLFIPGIEASRLYRAMRSDEGIGEVKLWEPILGGTHNGELTLTEDGREPLTTTDDQKIYTRDVIDESYFDINIYKSFLDELQKLKKDHELQDYKVSPYDWRLSFPPSSSLS